MRQDAGLVRIGVEIIAGKLVAITTKSQSSALGAFIRSTTMRFTEDMLLQRYPAIAVAAPLAKHDFNGNVEFP